MPAGGLTSSMRSSTAVFSPELNAVGAPVAARFPNCTLPPVEKISWLPIGPFPGALARTSTATVTAAATSATAAAAAQRRRIRRRCSGAAATDCSVGPAIAIVGSWSGSASQPAREYAPGDHRRLPSVGAADVVRLVGRAAEVVIELDVAVEPRPGRQADAEHVHPAAPPDRAVDLAMKRPARLIEPADRVVAHAPVQRAALLAGGLAAEEAGGHDRVVGPSLAVVVSDLLEALVVKPRLNLARVTPNLAVRDAALVATAPRNGSHAGPADDASCGTHSRSHAYRAQTIRRHPHADGRHRQRAYRDALVDLLPAVHGRLPTLRIAYFESRGYTSA